MILGLSWWEVIIRLVGAVILGAAFGFEREIHGRPAGLRTHILVCLGASLVMLISMYGFGEKSDPARLAAQVISGIGFLGAGAIIREGGDIKGITTAATLWIAAIVGLAIGNGMYFAAAIATIVSIVLLVFLRIFERKLGNRSHKMVVVIDGKEPMLKRLIEICDEQNVTIAHVEAKMIEYGKINALELSADFIHSTPKETLDKLFVELQRQLNPLSIKMK